MRCYLLRNPRKTATPAEGADREFLGCWPPRNAAFALLTLVLAAAVLNGQTPPEDPAKPVTLEYVGKPLKVPFACTEDDIGAFGLTCSIEQPCHVFLELSGLEALGNKMFLSGNLHTSEATLSSILLSSSDNGKTWTEPHERMRSTTIEQIQFFDFETGWIGGQQLISLPKDPFLLITNDGGKTWRRRPVFGEPRVGAIEQFAFDSRTSGALLINRTQTDEGGNRNELHETMTGGESWMVREVSGKPLKLKHPRLPNTDWRINADRTSKSFRIEKRQNGWITVAAFLIDVGECKPVELTLTEPTEPSEAKPKDKEEEGDPGVFRVGGTQKKAPAKKKKP